MGRASPWFSPPQAAKAPETTDEPEPPKKGRKRAVKATKEPEPINSPSEPEKPVKTEIGEKQLIRAGGSLTPYDVCEHYCKEKNCDYCLGEHGYACIEAKHRAGYIEPEIDEKLPWEQEPEPAKPAGPTPEQAAKDNLLNDEIEL